jgi:type I restriction enzyme S subunit
MGNLQNGGVDWRDLVFTNNDAEIRRYLLSPGDVLFNRTNTIDLVGKTAIYKGEQLAIFAGYLIRIIEDKSLLDSRFLNYVLNAEFSKRYSLKILSVAVGQANINGKKLKTYPVPVPPTLTEQQAIANTLSDMDDLIESLEQLLNKKSQIKQGAMEELLTGQRRLPGFSEEWEVKRLGAICHMKSGVGITRANINDYSLFPCFGGNGLRGFTSSFTHEGTYALIGRQGALCGNVQIAEGRFFASEHAVVVSAEKEVDINWMSRVLIRMNLNQYAESSAQPGLSVSKILKLECEVPPHAEQIAIACALSAMNDELTVLENKLQKARNLKQSMMQELLTGRIRLV